MHGYAQTNVQLFNQLRDEGYSATERAFVSDTYEFGMRIFAGFYLPSGKTFLDHLVGTASILARLRAPVEVVAAGLIHAAYLHGDFGTGATGFTEAKRTQLRHSVGDRVEEYVSRYDRLLLTRQDIQSLENTLDRISTIDRYVALMRLANELEHHLDFGALYYAHTEEEQRDQQHQLEQRGPLLVSFASGLGFDSLAGELGKTFRAVTASEVPLVPCIRCSATRAYSVIPKSFRKRFSIRWRRYLMSAMRTSAL